MSTRLAQPSDARAIAAVHVRSWQAAYRSLVPQDYLDGLDPERRSARWHDILSQGQSPRWGVIVAEDAGELVGFARVRPTRDDDLDPASVGEITSLYLVSDAWGRGLGRQLIAAARAVMSEACFREAALWVLDANQRARSFYEADGWRADGAVKQVQIADFRLRELRYRRPVSAGESAGA